MVFETEPTYREKEELYIYHEREPERSSLSIKKTQSNRPSIRLKKKNKQLSTRKKNSNMPIAIHSEQSKTHNLYNTFKSQKAANFNKNPYRNVERVSSATQIGSSLLNTGGTSVRRVLKQRTMVSA